MRRRLLAVAALALVFGCSRPNEATRAAPAQADAGPAVDPALMAFLSEARAAHHQANIYEASSEPGQAVESLEKLTRAPRPHPGAKVPEVEEVLADTYARLAELRLRASHFDEAARDVQEGLAHASDPTYFRGHLFEVAGLVEEARAASLADAGHASDADRARERALALLQEAVDIQNKVIADSLDAGP